MLTARSSQNSHPSRCPRATRRSAPADAGFGPETGGWRLPSGEGLAEFALHAGVVAPLLPVEKLALTKPGTSTETTSPVRRGEF